MITGLVINVIMINEIVVGFFRLSSLVAKNSLNGGILSSNSGTYKYNAMSQQLSYAHGDSEIVV
jgi:hypothetical protein